MARFCWPAVLPWLALAWELVRGFSSLDWTRQSLFAHIALVRALGPLLCAAAALLLWAPARRRLWSDLEEGSGTWGPGPWVAAAGAFAYVSHLYLVRHFAYSLVYPIDNADTINLVWGLLHGQGTYSTIRGLDILSIHFHATHALYAPVLALVPRPWGLYLPHSFLLASTGLCAFMLARRLTGSRAAGWLGMLLAYAAPSAVEIIRSPILMQSVLPAFFLWAVYFLETRRPWPALAAGIAFLGCSEHAAVTLGGFGAYLAASALSRRDKAGALRGLGTAALALVLFGLEMKLRTAGNPEETARYVGNYYAHLRAGAGDLPSPRAVVPTVLTLLHTALLPLASGWALLVFAAASLPMLLADPGTTFHQLTGHQAAYLFGPALWCAILGLAFLFRSPLARTDPGRLAAAVCLVLGLTHQVFRVHFLDYLSAADARTLGAAVRAVPEGASVWTEAPAAPALALRKQLKLLQAVDEMFMRGLFLPEYVLARKQYVARPKVGRVVTLLAREGYRKVFDADAIVVLKHPRAPFGTDSPSVELPATERAPAEAFAAYFLSPPDFPQEGLKRYYRSLRGWGPWVAFAEEVGRHAPPGSLLLHSGRFYPLPPLLNLFAGLEQIALSERLDSGGRGPGLDAVNAYLAQMRRSGAPAFTLSETFGVESMGHLARACGFTKEMAEPLMAPYAPVRASRLDSPAGRISLLLMRPKDASEAARLDAKLRKRAGKP